MNSVTTTLDSPAGSYSPLFGPQTDVKGPQSTNRRHHSITVVSFSAESTAASVYILEYHVVELLVTGALNTPRAGADTDIDRG